MTEIDVNADAVDSLNPEDVSAFRCARMLVLFAVAFRDGRQISSIDRLALYDFFADSPWVVIHGDRRVDVNDRRELTVAGFSKTQLSYASTGARFASRRQRVQVDLAQLVAFGLVSISGAHYSATELGMSVAERMHSAYADAYRTSAGIILRRLHALPMGRLQSAAEQWLGQSWLLLDLLDDVRGADLAEMIQDPPKEDS